MNTAPNTKNLSTEMLKYTSWMSQGSTSTWQGRKHGQGPKNKLLLTVPSPKEKDFHSSPSSDRMDLPTGGSSKEHTENTSTSNFLLKCLEKFMNSMKMSIVRNG